MTFRTYDTQKHLQLYHLLNVCLNQRILFPASDSQNKGLNKSCCQTCGPGAGKMVTRFVSSTTWSLHDPFTRKQVRANAYDMVINGVEALDRLKKNALSNDGVENQN